jgi:hypothetical protein
VDYKIVDTALLDARYNQFDNRTLEEVAASMSPMLYFLPYYDGYGNIVSTDDNDMDGMKDDWEIKNGFDPTQIADRFMDADGDRYSNYEEYREGTDPNDEDSNPGNTVRYRIVIFQVLLIFIPIMILVCYLYYFQIALASDKRRKFRRKYYAYKAQRDLNKRMTQIEEEKKDPFKSKLPKKKENKDTLPPPPPPLPLSPGVSATVVEDGGDEE